MHVTAWVVVLLASLAMPLVMHWPTLTITRLPLPVAAPDDLWPGCQADGRRPSGVRVSGDIGGPDRPQRRWRKLYWREIARLFTENAVREVRREAHALFRPESPG
ncbi:hypothetical protein QA640_12610 [Bradyrhizobium sp. CB82]|uniref:hypothetical protein n=1 Tax=Bradyrhizobium sp. CB82 TaxID=3039159 RepID=UPI0024B0F14C|nr:hypothetical protein [Bradyrhizobium sp. CB82]WFU43210.1 hypothetical protein QA640_12610 [Bradyrhizobium sp. CB82]